MTTEQTPPQTEDIPAGSPDVEVELAANAGPEAEIERLQVELQQAQETALRAAADAQNTRRRAEQDVERRISLVRKKLFRTWLSWQTT